VSRYFVSVHARDGHHVRALQTLAVRGSSADLSLRRDDLVAVLQRKAAEVALETET
jgi:hypothetical protein